MLIQICEAEDVTILKGVLFPKDQSYALGVRVHASSVSVLSKEIERSKKPHEKLQQEFSGI